ncbi:22405_t:CDS:10 [Cetraspora pellucida]|uniref:D-arabinono-1,4-lactone oxidase n=1 Tax=Cetraspora pellucida TaxID=1433469 RepID=A0A9N9G7F8_9GLOM|nr:22405_t:CDS:10 [Cetraspora pellucida]
MDKVILDERLKEISKYNMKIYNWSKTAYCTPELYFEPEFENDIVKIIELAKRNNKNVRAIGMAHSPSDLPFSDEYLISMNKLNRVIEVDPEAMTITVEAGMKISQLNEELVKHGLALSNLLSISDLTIAGMISTASHGTGINFGCLSTQIKSLTLLTDSCGKMYCSETMNSDVFKAALCSLGALGIITQVTIQCENAFLLEANQTPAKLNYVLDNLDVIVHSAEHVKLWWFPHTDDCIIWKANRTNKNSSPQKISYIRDILFGFYLHQLFLYFSRFQSSIVPKINQLIFSLTFSKPIHAIDDSYKIFTFDCLFPQYVNEWAIPIENSIYAIRDLKRWIETTGTKAHLPVEIRFVDQDDIWLSPSYGRKVCYIGIIIYRPYYQSLPYKKYWAGYESIMRSYEGRPHWAKKSTMFKHELEKAYPKLQSFIKLQKQLDPTGLFLNPYLKRHFFGENVDLKNLQSKLANETELGDDEKLRIMRQTLDDPALFLSKWGRFLEKEQLMFFDRLRDDYEVNWHLNNLQSRTSSSSTLAASRNINPTARHNKQILNRRYRYLITKLDDTSYFSDEAMEQREPLLYQDYVGQYTSQEEKYPPFADDVDLVDRILYDIDIDNLSVQNGNYVNTGNGQSSTTIIDSSPRNGSISINAANDVEEEVQQNSTVASMDQRIQISDEEREQLRADLVDIMRERFFGGNDPDFDYDAVDFNEEYDDINVEEQEIHDKYFDNEDPDVLDSGTGILDY